MPANRGSSGGGRAARIGAQMQRSLAELVRRGVKDPRVGNVTITHVEVAADMSVARIGVLPFGDGLIQGAQPDEAKRKALLEGLNSAASYLRGEVARELSLRHAPRLEFSIDTQIEYASRLTDLIDVAVKSNHHKGEDPPT